jgi:hypothetical protein
MRKKADPLAGIDDLPWSRMAHWYGRATDFLAVIRNLCKDEHKAAEKELLRCLEHQDGVFQATPFAVYFIVRLLRAGQVRDTDEVNRLLDRIQIAVRFQLDECYPKLKTKLGWKELLAEERLFPPFKSERDEEIWWEEYDPPVEEWVGWHALTREFLSRR